MHFSVSILALAQGTALAQALCPYAEQMGKREMPSEHPVISTRASHNNTKGLMLMNRIAPGTSELYIADVDGSNEQPLLADPVFEYHASWSPDGEWVLFTTERNGDGNADIYRVRPNGSDLEPLVTTPAVEDSVVLSPNGSLAAYTSTEGMVANIWLLDIATGMRWNLTDTPDIASTTNKSLPHGYFRPAWSPDGEWLAFSSDRNTQWLGHGTETFLGLSGWEHTQELAIYAIRPDGTGFRQVVTKEGYALGSPTFSPDGTRLAYYEMTREDTYNAHSSFGVDSTNTSIVSVDFNTGSNRTVEIGGAGVKVFPQYLDDNKLGYFLKGGTGEGLYITNGTYRNTTSETSNVRSPSWSPDGKKVVYEKTSWVVRAFEKPLFSWDDEWDYHFVDVFPHLSLQNRLVMTDKQLGDSSIINSNTAGGDAINVYDPVNSSIITSEQAAQGSGGAYQPSWSTDGEWITFGSGFWFQGRGSGGGWIVRATANGSYAENLTTSAITLDNNTLNSGFPSYSRDGKSIVFRVWGVNSSNGDESQLGLRLLDLETRNVTVLTTEWDNLPFFSPDGEKIVFTRKTSTKNYDICTIRPDGTDLQVLTTTEANDAHAVWSQDGRILYSTGEYGFQYECGLYDNTFQPYGQINIMDADGSNKRPLTNSMWEDSMPLFVANSAL